MWKAIVYKELRENLGLGLLALAVYLFMATTWVGPNVWPWSYAHSDYSIPFVNDGFNYLFAWVTGLLAVSIGLRQTIPESVRSTWLFLLHRPINRRRAVVLKLLTGASVYLLFSAVPILVYGLWAARPRTHASPFEMVDDVDGMAVVALDHGHLPGGFLGGSAARPVDRLPPAAAGGRGALRGIDPGSTLVVDFGADEPRGAQRAPGSLHPVRNPHTRLWVMRERS